MNDLIIPYADNIAVSTNEFATRVSLNRNLLKLLKNDEALFEYSGGVERGLYRVLPYEYGKTYSKNDIVWFVDYYVVPKNQAEYDAELNKLLEIDVKKAGTQEEINALTAEIEKQKKELFDKYHVVSLFLLRSLENGNGNEPKLDFVDMIPVFDASGWKNVNPLGTIYYDYFEDFTAKVLSEKLHEMHEVISKYHKFGTLSSYSEIDKKVLKVDFSNLNPDRSTVFFPYETKIVDSSKTIIEGTVRTWDCGLLEYDLTYKLGDTVNEYSFYAADGSVNKADNVDTNYLNLNPIIKPSDPNLVYDNSRYYLTESDADILAVTGNKEVYINGIKQYGMNGRINTYCGTITLPIAFIDTNYMIFGSGLASVEDPENEGVLEKNVNTLVYVNKAKKSFTAVLIVPTYEGILPKSLANNQFRCHIVGRWK